METLMNNEQPGVPRPQSRQQMGLNDMQLWQQQLMYRQFQELQRQQQLQQLDQQSRQQNSLNQLSGIAKHSSDQLAALVNGAPMHDAASYWTRELGGVDSKMPSTSQMHMVGGMNWVQRSGVNSMQSFHGGLILQQDQGHVLNPVGFASQQFEQSLYGAPVAGTRGNLSQFSPFQGISHANADIAAKLGSGQVEKQMVQPVAFNSFQIAQPPVFSDQHCTQDGASVSKEGLNEKNLFGPVPVPTLPNGTFSENFQQVGQFQRNAPAQEFLGRKDGDGWMGNLQEKTVAQVAQSQGLVSLDPTEEKILFGSDDGIWGAFGRTSGLNEGGFIQSNQFDNHLNAFPSIQSGSWSALMQSAVGETSSDTGPQDEWSGLSFQKPDPSTGNPHLPLDDNGKQPASWIHRNLQTASSSVVSRPFPLFDDASSNPGSRSISGFQQTNAEYALEGSERLRMNAFHESVSRMPEEVGKPPVEGSHQVQTSMHLEKTSEGAAERLIHEQSQRTADSKHMGFNAQFMQDSLVHQQNMSPYNTGSQSSHKPNAWNINEALSPNGNVTMRTSDTQNHVQNNDKKQAMVIEGDCGGMWKAEGKFMDISFPHASGRLEQVKSRKSSPQVHNETTLQNSRNSNISQETNQQIRHDGNLDYGNYVNVDSSIKYDGNENVGKFPHQTRKSPQAQESSYNNPRRGLVETETCDIKKESYSSAHAHSNQHSITEGSTRESAWLRQNDPHDVVGNNHRSSGQGVSQAAIGGLGRIEQAYHGQSRLSDNAVLDKAADTAKEHLPNFLRDAKGEMEVPSRNLNPGHYEPIMTASFHGSGSSYAPNRTQPSQNMLELLNKVDQSRDGKYITELGFSEQNKASQMPELAASVQSVTQHQSQSSAVQGFGLQLAPPSERISNMNHALSLQKSPQRADDVNVARFDETSQRERNQSSISGQTGIEAIQSIHGNSFPTGTLGNYPNNQRQEQQFPSTSGPIDPSAHGHLASHVRQARDSNDGGVDHSPRASLPGFYGRITPFNFPSSASPIASAQSYSSSAGHNQNPVMVEMSQQGALPLKPHNMWPNVAAQQHLSGRPSNNVPPSFFQPNHPAPTSLEVMSRAPLKSDIQVKGGNVPSEFVSSSVNTQQFPYREGQLVKDNCSRQMSLGIDLAPGTTSESQGQDPGAQKFSEAACSTSSSSVIHADHHLGRGEEAHEQLFIHSANASVSNRDTSDHDTEAFGHTLKPSDAQPKNYSLLHQMQTMKDAESDPTRMSVKRLKGADFGSAAAQVQHLAYGYGRTASDPVDELNVVAQHPSFAPADSKMLCFSSGRNEDLNQNASVQRDKHSKEIDNFGRNDPQNSSNHPGMASMPSHRVNEHPQINPQMAPSWFEKYGTYKNGQILAMHDELDSSKRNAKVAAQQFFFGNASESLSQTHSGVEQSNASNASQVGNIWQIPGSTTPPKEQLSTVYPLPNVDDPAITGSKKRKIMELDPPWRREVSQTLQSISMAEMEWAQASNRQIEKVEDDAEIFEECRPMPYQRRRLILTSQLMQQLFRSIPAAVLSTDATLGHESVIYFSAKLALDDACTGINSHIQPNGRNTLSDKLKNSETVGDQLLLKIIEDFIGRVKKLDNDLLRLEKRASILDIRVECQDLERFAIINRFARFHGRGNAPDAAGSSSSSGATINRTYPQRYVTAHPLPKNLPAGVPCLSL
ncbi:hypothetical protein ACLOJK_035569 [Asimina triloba]